MAWGVSGLGQKLGRFADDAFLELGSVGTKGSRYRGQLKAATERAAGGGGRNYSRVIANRTSELTNMGKRRAIYGGLGVGAIGMSSGASGMSARSSGGYTG